MGAATGRTRRLGARLRSGVAAVLATTLATGGALASVAPVNWPCENAPLAKSPPVWKVEQVFARYELGCRLRLLESSAWTDFQYYGSSADSLLVLVDDPGSLAAGGKRRYPRPSDPLPVYREVRGYAWSEIARVEGKRKLGAMGGPVGLGVGALIGVLVGGTIAKFGCDNDSSYSLCELWVPFMAVIGAGVGGVVGIGGLSQKTTHTVLYCVE